jgi:hypothetical protein
VTIAKRPSYQVRDARKCAADLPDEASVKFMRQIGTTGNFRMARMRPPRAIAAEKS